MASSKIPRLDRNLPLPKIVYQFLGQPIERLKEAMGLAPKQELIGGATSTVPTSLTKLDKSFTLGTQDYDVYSHKAWLIISATAGAAAFADLGLITVSTGPLLITKNSTNVAADDTGGAGGFTNNAIANTGTLVEDTSAGSTAAFPDFIYINQDDLGAGVENNFMYLAVVAPGGFDIEAEVYVDIEFIVEKGAEVELIRA